MGGDGFFCRNLILKNEIKKKKKKKKKIEGETASDLCLEEKSMDALDILEEVYWWLLLDWWWW